MSTKKPDLSTDPAALVLDLEELYESAPCGYVSLTANAKILKVNRTLLDWLGYQPDELVAGKKFQELLNIAGKIYFETHFAPLLRMQGFFNEVALDLVGKGDIRLPVLVNAKEKRVEGGAAVLIHMTVFNATQRRRYEQDLLAARRAAEEATAELARLNTTLEQRVAEEIAERMKVEEALRQAQKMEAIGQLTGGVAHDFNNLLTVVLGGLETIDRQVALLPEHPATARIRRSNEMAAQAAERAAVLTSRLLAFSRRQPLDPKPIDANRLVAGISEILRRTLGELVAMETVSAAGLWATRADPHELENALVNLAVNARDAMPDGGQLTIETGNISLDEAYVEALVEPVPPGQYVMIAVSDTGLGMDTVTLDHVFEPFFTTKQAGKGTGLGLSQVYGFVRQSGGHVRIYSEPGHGTTVKLYLPRIIAAAAETAETPRRGAAALEGGSETILLVEDHDDLRVYSSGVLRELGYAVLEAANGPAALDLLRSQPHVDLLFTDVVLPGGLDGRRLADEARRLRPGIKVLFTTGYTRNAIVHNGRLDPGVAFILKPFNYAQLAAKTRKVLDSD